MMPGMASIRERPRADGTSTWAVLFTEHGKQTSVSHLTEDSAKRFKTLVESLGAVRAREIAEAPRRESHSKLTVADWVKHHIDHRTGVQAATVAKYRAYLDNDIGPALGDVPLRLLSRDDVAAWVNAMDEDGASGKTIKNKANFFSGTLKAAVMNGAIPYNPFMGVRLPEWDRREKVFLSHAEFALLHDSVTEFWQPFVEFLVASGCRFGEATALRPSDIDVAGGTVRISRAWKSKAKGAYELGPPKSKKSRRTVDVDRDILRKLHLEGEWLFENRVGTPIRSYGFYRRVWAPALARAKKGGLTKTPRVHDLRHTCASWMVQANIPLPVVQMHLGHENISTTIDTYSSVDRRSGQIAATAIGDALRRGTDIADATFREV